VAAAYLAHRRGQSSLPHSSFLRFSNRPRDRIIALPAYLGDGWETAGIKWIASFPGNLQRGLPRASALMVLNSMETGRPQAILEGSIISAQRTAASAALGAKWLHGGRAPSRVGLIGCGLINFEIARFLLAVWPQIAEMVVFDVDPGRAQQFADRCRSAFPQLEAAAVEKVETVLAAAPVIALATTAVEPHIGDLSAVAPGGTILHISLRDLSPEVILGCDNVVDDADHVCRAQTSVHLAEERVGHRKFIRATLADVLSGEAPGKDDPRRITVFSPFGLGVLDLAVGKWVCDAAARSGCGTVIQSFLPESHS